MGPEQCMGTKKIKQIHQSFHLFYFLILSFYTGFQFELAVNVLASKGGCWETCALCCSLNLVWQHISGGTEDGFHDFTCNS